MAQSILRSVVRSEGCNVSTQNLPVQVMSAGLSHVYSIPDTSPIAFSRGPSAALTQVSSLNFKPYSLIDQKIFLDGCRILPTPGTAPSPCNGIPAAGRVVFEARFRLTLEFGSGLGSTVKQIEEITSLFGESDGSNMVISGCRPSGAAAASAKAINTRQFCDLLGPGGSSTGLLPTTPPSTLGATAGMFRPKFNETTGKCELRRTGSSGFIGGPLAYAIGGRDGNFTQFQDAILRLNVSAPNATCGAANVIGFSRRSYTNPPDPLDPLQATDPYLCRNNAVPPTNCDPNCIRKWSDNCTLGPDDAGFRLEHRNSGGPGWTTNTSCMGFTFQIPSGVGTTTFNPVACGKQCN